MDNLSTQTPEPLTSADIALLLGVEPHNIKNWRRLPVEHERHLPATRSPDTGHWLISVDDFLEWLNRPANVAHLERVVSLMAPPQARASLLPRSVAARNAQALRGEQPAPVLEQPALNLSEASAAAAWGWA